MKVREIIKLIKADGWYLVATKDSHQQYKHPPNQAEYVAVAEKSSMEQMA